MKVVINKCFGGFSLSEETLRRFNELDIGYQRDDDPAIRSNPKFIELLEEIGLEKAGGRFAKLVIIDIPMERTDTWHIEEYDGLEHIAENHRIWR